jgi:ribonucleoside-diphosphate reductase alpha chain
LNAGVGILGLAHHMARKGLKYNTPEGLAEIDRVMERHAYFVIKASLKLGQERGNAPWMHRTKWPEGWLPIDTYKKTVDELVPFKLRYPWEELRAAIIANGGIRNSSLMALMPTESSSKASGAPNGPYQVRDLDLKKSDSSNILEWCAPDNDLLADQYQLAWETTPIEQIKYYAVMQKWIDQSISADIYRDRTKRVTLEDGSEIPAPITDDELFQEQHAIVKYGVKSEYYMNSFTGGSTHDDDGQAIRTEEGMYEKNGTLFVEKELEFAIERPGCGSGGCTL